ncbi:DUF6318 family protein [Pseudarthrobacter sp. P1]|uniref:DUF6318 family protein n=1 Tax=Pseudarthrobacter sp. P1 TaxID=3418418 RepID=UPI003CFB39C0
MGGPVLRAGSTTAAAGSSAAAAAAPTAASATAAARNIPVPTPFTGMDKDGVDGLKAFTFYWFDVQNYLLQTGDDAPLRALSDPACVYCTEQSAALATLYKDGGWMQGGQPKVLNIYPADATDGGVVKAVLDYRSDASTTYAKDGSTTASVPYVAASTLMTVEAKYAHGKWTMLSVAHTPDAAIPGEAG